MKEVTTRYVGLDVHKATISIAVADDGVAPVLFGTIANDATAVRKAVSQLKRGGKLVAAYEAGPTGQVPAPAIDSGTTWNQALVGATPAVAGDAAPRSSDQPARLPGLPSCSARRS